MLLSLSHSLLLSNSLSTRRPLLNICLVARVKLNYFLSQPYLYTKSPLFRWGIEQHRGICIGRRARGHEPLLLRVGPKTRTEYLHSANLISRHREWKMIFGLKFYEHNDSPHAVLPGPSTNTYNIYDRYIRYTYYNTQVHANI